MSMKIEVNIPEDVIRECGAADYLARAMSAIGYNRGVSLAMPEPRQQSAMSQAATTDTVAQSVSDVSEKTTDETAPEVHIVRERGKPAPGKARRTKAEIEEDEAADAEDLRVAGHAIANADIEPKAAISTGEERVSPEDEAAAEQDAADEAADPANATGAEQTREDVRAAMMAYGQKMGMDKLTTDLLAILSDNFPGGKVTKLSEIPEDAAAFKLVIDALNAKMEG